MAGECADGVTVTASENRPWMFSTNDTPKVRSIKRITKKRKDTWNSGISKTHCRNELFGELFTVPHADLAKWIKEAGKVIVIDGCSLFCHSRIAQNLIGKDRLIVFDSLSIHRKYANLMDVDDVSEQDRRKAAREVADRVLANLDEDVPGCPEQPTPCGCERESRPAGECTA